MSELIVVYVTVGSGEEADRMAQALVGEQLAACVNRVRSIQSVYRWQGKIEQNDEELLIIKTRRQLFPALEKRVKELHSYSIPEIIGLPIIEGSADYLTWLREQALAKPPQDENIRTVREVSAGGVIYRRSGELAEVALIHVRNRWGLPKGHVEEGERVEETALREVREETGLDSRLVEKLDDIRYWYTREGARVLKVVSFFLLAYRSGSLRDYQREEVDGAEWIPLEEAPDRLANRGEQQMARAALSKVADKG